ncbi:MAG TPA: pilus assembly protein TadG-related protein [Chloroflexota bacterium]|jgi:uncharacterized membrane protein
MRLLRGRQPAQALGLAAVAMVGMVGMLAFVIDAGSFFVVRRELQNAADAAALAAVAMCPCPLASPSQAQARFIAQQYVAANAFDVEQLCRHAVLFVPATDVTFPSPRDLTGVGFASPVVTVTVRCEADYTFGRILNLPPHRTISAHATAALGAWDVSVTPHQVVNYVNGSPNPTTTRLIPD